MIVKRTLIKLIEWKPLAPDGIAEMEVMVLGEDYLEVDTSYVYSEMEYYDMLPKSVRELLREVDDRSMTAKVCFGHLWKHGKIGRLLRLIEDHQRRK